MKKMVKPQQLASPTKKIKVTQKLTPRAKRFGSGKKYEHQAQYPVKADHRLLREPVNQNIIEEDIG